MDTQFYVFVVLLLCYIYFIITSLFQHRKSNYIHQTTVALVLGAVFGVFLYFFTNIFSSSLSNSIQQLMFLTILPPMLFEDGYNVPKRNFFQNIFYANLFGLLGSVFHFFFFYGVIYAFNEYSNQVNRKIQSLEMTFRPPSNSSTGKYSSYALVLSVLILSLLRRLQVQNDILNFFSIIFGQSILKDTITVTLFQSIVNVYRNEHNSESFQFQARQLGILVGNFIEVIICSILIGVAAGLITTLIFKNCRFLILNHGVTQVALVIITGYVSYLLSQWGDFSGVVSMLFCGIVLSHFNMYNMTDEGKVVTKSTIRFLALLAEGILFFLVGAFLFNVQYGSSQKSQQSPAGFSYVLLAIVLVTLFVGRIINIFLMSLFGWLILSSEKWRLNWYDLQIIFVSGLVKGAIPFALILSIPQSQSSGGRCLITNITFVVFITSLLLNSILPKILRNRLEHTLQLYKIDPFHPSLKDSFLLSFSPQSKIRKTKKSSTQKYWNKIQQGFLKPCFIYNYHIRRQDIKSQKLKRREEQYKQYLERFQPNHKSESQGQEGFELMVHLQSSSSDEEIDNKKHQSSQQIQQIHKETEQNGISKDKKQILSRSSNGQNKKQQKEQKEQKIQKEQQQQKAK